MMEKTITMMTEEEAPEVGPNDIVIHLVNPFKCGICELEFLDRVVFKDHMFAHLEHIKHEHPSSQIVMNIILPPETPGGVTVTRDILQLGEDGSIRQVLQPSNSINMNQVSPLRELEEAGVIKLDYPKFEMVSPKIEAETKAKPVTSSFNNSKIVQPQLQQVDLLGSGVIPIESTAEVEGLIKEEDNVEGDVSQIVDNKDGSFSFAFKGLNNELQHIQIIRPSGIKGGLMMELTNIHDRRKTNRIGGNKNNECDICGKILSSSTNLLRHKMYHSTERPFRCDVCLKGFKDVSNLKKHTMIHKRIFPCHLCKKSFLRKSLLASHLVRHESRTAMVKTGNSMKEITFKTFVDDDGTRVEEMSMVALNGQTFEYKHRIAKADPATVSKDIKKEIEVLDAEKLIDPDSTSTIPNALDAKNGNQRPIFTVTMDGLQVASLDQGTSTDDAQNVSLEGTNTSSADTIDVDDMPDLKIVPTPDEIVKMYQCGHCGKRTVQRGNMMRHLIHHLKEKPFVCDECPKQFVDKGELVKHKKTHTKPYRCPQCNGAFAHNVQLMKHLESDCLGNQEQLNYTVMEDGKTYKCNMCCIEMKRLGNMIKHVSTHNAAGQNNHWNRKAMLFNSRKGSASKFLPSDKPTAPYYYNSMHKAFFCGFCSKSFTQKVNVHRHVRMHNRERAHTCMYCKRWFSCASSLNRHIQIHTKPFKCDKCSCAFSRQFFLDTHIKNHSHTEVREDNQDYSQLDDKSGYYCKHCQKKFNKRIRIMNHVKSHLFNRSFECQTCNKCFNCRYLLLKHVKSHTKPFVCKLCGETFTRKFFLLLHKKKMHNFQNVINAEIDSTSSTKNETDDSFFCSVCGAPFARLVIKMNHEKKCGNESKVMVRLSDGKGYKCKICNKVATLKHNLMVHIRKHNEVDTSIPNSPAPLDDRIEKDSTTKAADNLVEQSQVKTVKKSNKINEKPTKMSTPRKQKATSPTVSVVSGTRSSSLENSTSVSSRRPSRTQKTPSRFLD